ncbi:hypothetical protein [Seleniivibrio sp.]|uniref:hypothetical protein n=1 Tax=Seleniivibrio sp. TaxID=2898801 RepID=UPI0025FACDC0|nr:hypothetical protein [Seleniivibrio sp.]MCD8553791.1 hypothetical protein [Seleniivibrio sp.]
MKRLLLLLAVLLISAVGFAAGITDNDIRGFFPKADDLPGGSELWLGTGVRSTPGKNNTAYSATYSYYSGKSEKLMNIVRRDQYKTNVAIYSFNNFVDAEKLFKQLTDDAPKNRSQMVRFGERGLFFIFPKSSNINDADFYLVFINRTFVVWIQADDGFAIMDIANPVNDAIRKFIADNPKLYMTKAIHLQASGNGYETQTKRIEFTTDFPASIKLSGKVFNNKTVPMQNVRVTVLETGDSVLTAADGSFSKTLLLDGIKDIELSANFYMDMDAASRSGRFASGLVETVLKDADGAERTQLWKLDSVTDSYFGTAYIKTSKGTNGYPISGKIMKNGQLNLTLDCSNTGIDFKCQQVFTGQIKSGKLQGKWSGTGGGGTFESDLSKYSAVTRKVMITKDVADIRTMISNNNGIYTQADTPSLVVSSNANNNAIIYAVPDVKKLGLDEVTTAGVKLVLTHVPKNQAGSLSVFLMDADAADKKVRTGRGTYSGQVVTSEEPYKAEFEVYDMIKDGKPFALGTVQEAKATGFHVFSGSSEQYDTLKPYFLITEYSDKGKTRTEKQFTFVRTAMKGGDYVGDRNKPQQDGIEDVCYSGVFAYPGGRLTSFELEISGSIKRVFNTNPVDIYPLIGIVRDNTLLNKKDGSLNIMLTKPKEQFSLCVNGNYKPEKNERITYRYTIDGTPYEGFAE